MAQPLSFIRPPLQDATRQIRLLQLQVDDRRGRGDKVIQCTLDVHSLEDVVGQYVAVSYTWGGTDETHTVLVNGQKHQVRYNCWQALDQLKQHGNQEYCFVDSICIDQGSHREKRQQVGQMSTIYSGAKFVAASLGGKAGGQEQAMRLFSSDMLTVRADPKEWVQMLHHISERRYFTRVWTTQECILAQKVDFFCGRSRVPLDILETKLKQQTRAVLGLAMLTQLTSFLDDCSALKKTQPLEAQTLSLCDSIAHKECLLHPATAIIRYGVRECVDPRDKIFGLHSLMLPAARARIAIDYEMPLFDVLLEYISSHECLLDQGAHEAQDIRKEDEAANAASLGEAMLSIRLLVHQFAATSPEFRRALKDFCSKRKRYNHRRETSDAKIAVVICPAVYHTIATDSYVAHGRFDGILRSGEGDWLLEQGLRPVVSHPSLEGDWKFHQACSCCEQERPQFTKVHSKDLACVQGAPCYASSTSSSNPHRLLYKGNQNNDAGLVFQVPKETSNGDILLFIGSYDPISGSQKSFRQFLVCRKQPEGHRGYQILGPAFHRATMNVGGEILSLSAYAHSWSYGLQKRALISRDDLLALCLTTREELVTSKFEKTGFHDRLNMVSLRMPERSQEPKSSWKWSSMLLSFWDMMRLSSWLKSACRDKSALGCNSIR
ncbi:hypothetical protein AC578_5545 [Pseudocercospora eumusae]|uniref:Heterokaryon incompatibility domain-containing protein n=1 Tax=Pseudocercospora eumusae TaxID=321146 RepID=A0A139H3N8_9PEZI|nr:hypothetical protein AC578_5545 [Pseudocercospora eumusae]